MAIEIDDEQSPASLPDHLRQRPRSDPERARYEKGWGNTLITWFTPPKNEDGTIHHYDTRTRLLFLFLFFIFFSASLYGLQYYVDTVQAIRSEIKETLHSKGYSPKDPLVKQQYEELEKAMLLSKLRNILAMAQTLPDKNAIKAAELTPLNSYLAYIKANNLPFNSREAILWLAKQYR